MSSPTNSLGALGGQQRILNFAIRDKSALYASYMPYIKNGGLFIPTTKRYQLDDEIFLLLQLMEETDRIPVAGRVVWITPPGAEGNRSVGVGVQFSDQDKGAARRKIEEYLAGMLNSERPTHTM
ncbi:PilZ domain-containing protein [Marichromatium gracile]|uniref:Type IV pilus assembly protein PilZ n=1 Tax=Marichromatium gracile TaxID=1048 RepID=A0A4R4AB70_MARGR|nr:MULTISPECIES: PilZ domain-containing protein [Marichromatium]MBO8085978.1 PilZ domain-containing protein [Marichromatium sp.]MBK1708188.1 pilus assembly protein PilZ [Marichromatium gracile]MCF1182978.1 PilZ domain-containing protein [Marichromatium gracile]RNE89577.1 pilus assembly protein PilZ [Marichromatium sp. AB31]RNE94656.1 pilus assembly protein PilZ [Marichromatium sp. AB32]